MDEYFFLISEIKARAVTVFKLSPESVQEDCDLDQFIHDNDKNNKNNNVLKKKNEDFQLFLRENSSNINYSEAQQRFSELSQEGI